MTNDSIDLGTLPSGTIGTLGHPEDPHRGQGPSFDTLTLGQVFDYAPPVTLTEGLAAAHQAIFGDRLRLGLDHDFGKTLTHRSAPPAHPGLVWNLSIGQSTLVTQNAVANLFYRGLTFHRIPSLGDTIRTSTRITELRANRPKPGRRPTGMVTMQIVTTDQNGHTILDYSRCAMLPVRDPNAPLQQDVSEPPVTEASAELTRSVASWDLQNLPASPSPAGFQELRAGQVFTVPNGDVVTSAPELARLTLNLAQVHHDQRAAGGQRLVYGGHTIGLAFAQITRIIPELLTVVSWESCDHLGPVREGDTVQSTVEIVRVEPLTAGKLVHLRARVRAHADDQNDREVLDWRLVGLVG